MIQSNEPFVERDVFSRGDPPTPHVQGIGGLIRELRDEFLCLLRQEIALARAETTEKAKVAARQSMMMIAGGLLAYAALICTLFSVGALIAFGLVYAGLQIALAAFIGLLIVGVVAGIAAYAMIQKALSTFRSESLVPDRTLHSLQENKQWIVSKTK